MLGQASESTWVSEYVDTWSHVARGHKALEAYKLRRDIIKNAGR